MPSEVDGWGEYRRLILSELERLSRCVSEQTAEIGALRTEIATLKTEFRAKAGLWGAITGGIPALIGAVLWLLSR